MGGYEFAAADVQAAVAPLIIRAMAKPAACIRLGDDMAREKIEDITHSAAASIPAKREPGLFIWLGSVAGDAIDPLPLNLQAVFLRDRADRTPNGVWLPEEPRVQILNRLPSFLQTSRQFIPLVHSWRASCLCLG